MNRVLQKSSGESHILQIDLPSGTCHRIPNEIRWDVRRCWMVLLNYYCSAAHCSQRSALSTHVSLLCADCSLLPSHCDQHV